MDMLHPSNDFKQDIDNDKDVIECSNQECITSLKATNFLQANGLLGKTKNQASSFKDGMKQKMIEKKSDAVNTNNMAESMLVLSSKSLSKIIDKVDELDAKLKSV